MLTLGVLSAAGCGGGGEARQAGTGASTAPSSTGGGATTDAAVPDEPQDITEAGATAIDIVGDWLAVGAESVWLSDPLTSRVFRLDPETGETLAAIQVPQKPCASIEFGFDSLWTATCKAPGLARIDPQTNRVSGHVALRGAGLEDGEASVAAGEGAVWLVTAGANCRSCLVARVDPESLEVVARVRVENGAAGVRAGEGAVWVTNPSRSLVQKIDARANRVAATTRVGPEPRFLAVGEGAVWTLNQGDGSVTRVDPGSAEVSATIAADVIGHGGDLTTGGGSVWARGRGYLLTRIDPQTDTVVGRYGPSVGSGGVIFGFGAVWISAHDVETLWRLPLDEG